MRPNTNLGFRVVLLSSAILSVAVALAQVSTGQLLGTVEDSSGAVVPDATVTLMSSTGGYKSSTITNSYGSYVFPQVPVGQYSLEVSKAGFKRFTRTGITLDVNQNARVDVRVEVGSVTQTVRVNANATLVDTVDGQTGAVVTEKEITDMPLNGRQFLQLAFLTPGAVATPNDYRTAIQGVAPATNGIRPEENDYTLNGAVNAEGENEMFMINPSVDAVDEFKIQTGSFNAEFGRAGGAIVNVVTRAGTNSFHGSLFEFLRNSDLNARNFFSPSNSQAHRNNYGGTVGGPIWKNHTFFFFDYEAFKERDNATNLSLFPTAAQLSGNFSAWAGVLVNPATGVPYTGNIIPANQIDPIATKYSAIWPQNLLNFPGTSFYNFINTQDRKQDNNTYGGRLDHYFSEKDRIFFAADWVDMNSFSPGGIPNGPGGSFNNFNNRLANLTYTHTFSGSLINEVRLSYGRFDNPEISSYTHSDYATALGLTGLSTDPNIRDYWPGVGFGQGYSGVAINNDYQDWDNVYTVTDNLSWVRGSHNLKFGFGYIHNLIAQSYVLAAPTYWAYDGIFKWQFYCRFSPWLSLR